LNQGFSDIETIDQTLENSKICRFDPFSVAKIQKFLRIRVPHTRKPHQKISRFGEFFEKSIFSLGEQIDFFQKILQIG
jgi:hypothetical protein